jgi:GntR family transcriptional regulator
LRAPSRRRWGRGAIAAGHPISAQLTRLRRRLKEFAGMATSNLSKRPLYLQLRDVLVGRIVEGIWKPGPSIPNEDDLAREFNVSHGTIRKALDLLESERLVTRRQGRGTFVNDQSSEELAARFIRFRDPEGGPLIGDVKSVEISENSANEMEIVRLRLQREDRVFRLSGSRFSNGQPFAFEEASVSAAFFPGLEKRRSNTHCIVYLSQSFGVFLGKAEERISLGAAPAGVAGALNIPEGSPVAVMDRVVRAIDGRPVEWRMAWCELREHHYLASMS